MLKQLTYADLESLSPCKEAWMQYAPPLDWTGTVLDVLDAEHVPAEHRLWVALHPQIIGERLCHEAACVFAERALEREREAGREPDLRSWEAIKVKRAWLDGHATDAELATARDAAWGAANAAWGAAWDAARDAAWAAEQQWQIGWLRERLEKA